MLSSNPSHRSHRALGRSKTLHCWIYTPVKIKSIGPGLLACLPVVSGEASWIRAAEKPLCLALCKTENPFIKIEGLEWHFLFGGVYCCGRLVMIESCYLVLAGIARQAGQRAMICKYLGPPRIWALLAFGGALGWGSGCHPHF